MGPCARARFTSHILGGKPRKKSNLANDHYANLQPPWVLHDGILTFSYMFQEKILWDHARARARFTDQSLPQKFWSFRKKSLIEGTLRVKIPQESIKTLSKHLSPLLFHILALLGLCDTFCVTNRGLNFGWFPGHKI